MAVTAKPAPFRPDLAGWLATGKAVGTGDGGGRGTLDVHMTFGGSCHGCYG
uniref:Uncharacterized protein n=1 Tax=Oryza sativa subsp. japonica TaxID=39947 RepID=Q6K1Q9_ORYSJ|nr:hypothetical protein [Oryza sativa Japonica Group]